MRTALLAAAAVILTACASSPPAPSEPQAGTPAPQNEPARTQGVEPAEQAKAGDISAPAVAPVEIPRRAAADFERALGLMKAGRSTDAELEFKQLAAAYPQFAGPQINVGLMQRKAGKLEDSETALRAATQANPGSAVAWNELGVTLRMRGKFQDAAGAYERAIAADPNFAPAHRNFGVLLDLYLGDAERALTELEKYKELTGEDKPVSSWIAELRQRTGKTTPRPQSAPAPPTQGEPAPESAPPATPEPAKPDPEAAPAPPARAFG